MTHLKKVSEEFDLPKFIDGVNYKQLFQHQLYQFKQAQNKLEITEAQISVIKAMINSIVNSEK